VDDLEQAVAENRASRLQAADAAQAIIDVQVDRFLQEQQAASRQAIVRELRHFADHTRQSLLARAQQQLAAGKPAEQVLEQFANSLTKQLLHPPTMALRQAALSNDDSLLDAAARLFPLPSPAKTDTPRADDSDPAP